MKIGNPEGAAPIGGVRAQDTTQKQGTQPPKATAAGAPAANDASVQVQLSAAASGLLGAAAAEPEFDADKVARISQAIADGSFKIDADAIADKMLANARELLGKAGGR